MGHMLRVSIDPDVPETVSDVLSNAAHMTRNPVLKRCYERANRSLFHAASPGRAAIDDSAILRTASDAKLSKRARSWRDALLKALIAAGVPPAARTSTLRRLQRKLNDLALASDAESHRNM